MNRHRPTILIALFFALAVFCIFPLTSVRAAQLSGKVIKVLDGDSMIVRLKDGDIEVRLYGVDAPEYGQAFGQEAKRFVHRKAFGKQVSIKVKDRDKFDRMVSEVILPGGENLGHELVTAGLAWWFKRFASDVSVLQKLEDRARKKRIGIWAQKNPVAPWTFRYQQKNKK